MTRFRLHVAPMLALFAFTFGLSAFGQDLFEGYQAAELKDASATEEEKAAGEKESIF